VDIPEPRYAKTSDGVTIAYQVVGEGDPDIVFVNSPYLSDIELGWEYPFLASLLRGLASRGRLIWFDRRGAGLSDALSGERLPTIEARVEDIRAVMDAVGSERPIVIGMEDGAAQCFLFAATYPERTRALVTFNATVKGLWAPDAPWAWTEEQWTKEIEGVEQGWGTPRSSSRISLRGSCLHARATPTSSAVTDGSFDTPWARLMLSRPTACGGIPTCATAYR
jgi:pimeloyl-ACP methyl ester carboxylesterase